MRPIAAVRRIRPEPGNQKHPQMLVAPKIGQHLLLAIGPAIATHRLVDLVQQWQQRLAREGSATLQRADRAHFTVSCRELIEHRLQAASRRRAG